MSEVQTLAGEAYDAFEWSKRPDGLGYLARKDDAPEWLADIIHKAHGDMLPDDWRYEVIRDAFGAIHDAGTDLDEAGTEFASRGGYVDEAISEFGPARDFYHSFQMGQYQERSEIYGIVLAALRRLADDDED